MTQNQKTLIGVGVLAVAGYFVYQNYRKKSFANFIAPITIVSKCKASPTGYLTSNYQGKPIYQCCGKNWGYAPGPSPCTKAPDVAVTTISASDSTSAGF